MSDGRERRILMTTMKYLAVKWLRHWFSRFCTDVRTDSPEDDKSLFVQGDAEIEIGKIKTRVGGF